MLADRLLSILMHLQVHRRATARELAGRLEVSERTVHRDMEALSIAGVPVYAQRGAGGGWFLPEGYRTDLTGLGGAEVRALFLARPARLLADLGLDGAAEGALGKLLAALPGARRRDAESVRGRIHVDVAGWRGPGEAAPCLRLLQDAVWGERRVRLSYGRDGEGAAERVADPLGLVAMGSVWYLVASVGGEPRTYRASRVRGVELTDEPCARPEGFDLAAYWEDSKGRFVAGLPRYPVTVRADPELLPRLRGAGRWSRVEHVGPPGAGGWATVRMRFEIEEDARECLLGFGPRVEVLEPGCLREEIARLARETAAAYPRGGSTRSRRSAARRWRAGRE